MLESYVERWRTANLDNFRYVLRGGMMGWFTLMLDTTAWNQEQHTAARVAIALYKAKLRPLIREANLYHVSDRPDGVHWDGIEYFDQARSKGVLFAFHGSSFCRDWTQGKDIGLHSTIIRRRAGPLPGASL